MQEEKEWNTIIYFYGSFLKPKEYIKGIRGNIVLSPDLREIIHAWVYYSIEQPPWFSREFKFDSGISEVSGAKVIIAFEEHSRNKKRSIEYEDNILPIEIEDKYLTDEYVLTAIRMKNITEEDVKRILIDLIDYYVKVLQRSDKKLRVEIIVTLYRIKKALKRIKFKEVGVTESVVHWSG